LVPLALDHLLCPIADRFLTLRHLGWEPDVLVLVLDGVNIPTPYQHSNSSDRVIPDRGGLLRLEVYGAPVHIHAGFSKGFGKGRVGVHGHPNLLRRALHQLREGPLVDQLRDVRAYGVHP
jgi:hypothetical protein